MDAYRPWGRHPPHRQIGIPLFWRSDAWPAAQLGGRRTLPFGNGRSYGDVCQAADGVVLDCRRLDRLIAWDPAAGVLRCEAGLLLGDLLRHFVPQGWFLPVVPGTQQVTVGGAIANDVHGKNHHRAGTFGGHVQRFELLRSDGTRLECTPQRHAEQFAATIGGLGLTGVITWAELRLRRIPSPCIEQEVVRFSGLDGFFDLAEASDPTHEYTVAWVDCLARGRALGRGLFIRGNHAAGTQVRCRAPKGRWTFPVDPPFALLGKPLLRGFNALYHHWPRPRSTTVHYRSFFFPLDRIQHWNRLYGRAGFLQYQCVVPTADQREAIRALLQRVAAAGTGSFLAVLKAFGDRPSPGLLSFPMAGTTLALDFPMQGPRTERLLAELDAVVREAGGRLYPAKDARMAPADFQRAYPRWRRLQTAADPALASRFWERVTRAAA